MVVAVLQGLAQTGEAPANRHRRHLQWMVLKTMFKRLGYMPRARALMERAGFTVRPAPTAASGPSQPEARLGLVRDLLIELSAWTFYRVTGAL